MPTSWGAFIKVGTQELKNKNTSTCIIFKNINCFFPHLQLSHPNLMKDTEGEGVVLSNILVGSGVVPNGLFLLPQPYTSTRCIILWVWDNLEEYILERQFSLLIFKNSITAFLCTSTLYVSLFLSPSSISLSLSLSSIFPFLSPLLLGKLLRVGSVRERNSDE